jgi:type I restriction enzyme S subunit
LVARSPSYAAFSLFHASSDALIRFVDAASTGTKMPRASWGDISRFPIAIPPEPIAAQFEQNVAPMLDLIISNIHESRELSAMRDILLPKLLLGELRIRDAEHEMEKVA